MHSPPRILLVLFAAALLPASLPARGRAEPAPAAAPATPARVYPVNWYNVSAAPLVAAAADPVTQAIEKRFAVKLTLMGGPQGSPGWAKLFDDIAANRGLGPNDVRHRGLPDVFPWTIGATTVATLTDLFAPLSLDLAKARMPRAWTEIQVIARRNGVDPANVWAAVSVDNVPYAVPRASAGWMFPRGVLWRADVLEQLGKAVPATVEEWEDVFRAYRRINPTRVPWVDARSSLPFVAVFQATGIDPRGFVVRDGRIEPGVVQPAMKRAVQTLRRWFVNKWAAFADYRIARGATTTGDYFVAGASIVTTEARAETGSWVCEIPWIAGSMQDLCAARIPGAAFAMGPYPVFAGVRRSSAGTRGAPFTDQCFGFNRELADQPGKLGRVMEVVDALAGDPALYRTVIFGIEGVHWRWERIGDGRYPRRLLSSPPSNAGSYWVLPTTPLEAEYSILPRVQDSITRAFGAAASYYGDGSAPAGSVAFAVPLADTDTLQVADRARYRALVTQLWSRFAEYVVGPLTWSTPSDTAFDDFVSWYRDTMGDEVDRIVRGWAGR